MTTKHDDGKWRYSLLPTAQILEVVKVLEYGAQKYCVNNWRSVPDEKTRYFDAAMRHMHAWWHGETEDEESGCSHLAHAVCCLLFLMWFDGEKK